MASNAVDAYEMMMTEKPDLLLLDIDIEIAGEKSSENSFDLLKRIPTYNFDVIFITAFNEYAIPAIKLHAFDYLLKPVNVKELITAINDVKDKKGEEALNSRLQELVKYVDGDKQEAEFIWIPTLTGHSKVTKQDIVSISTAGHYSEILFAKESEKVISRLNLKKTQEVIQDENFYQIRRSHIINLDHVQHVAEQKEAIVVMSNGNNIPIARGKSYYLF